MGVLRTTACPMLWAPTLRYFTIPRSMGDRCVGVRIAMYTSTTPTLCGGFTIFVACTPPAVISQPYGNPPVQDMNIGKSGEFFAGSTAHGPTVGNIGLGHESSSMLTPRRICSKLQRAQTVEFHACNMSCVGLFDVVRLFVV